MHNRKLYYIKESVYSCFYVFVKAVAILFVGETLHHQSPFPGSVVSIVPLGRAPPLHHLLPTLRIRSAPIRNHLPKTSKQNFRIYLISILMLCIYLQVLLCSQRHSSGILLAESRLEGG
jgi:hypothetical protein